MLDIYVADTHSLDNEKLFQYYYNLMPKTRQDKIDKYLFMRDKKLSLGAGILLKNALAKLGIDIMKETFIEKANKKPYLKGRNIFFNLSHSIDKVMCAVSNSEIGCDIEKIENINLDIAKRFFYNEEYELILNQHTQKDKNHTFFRLWTLKESFMKITGLGFNLALNDFCIYFEKDTPKVRHNVNKKQYYFQEYQIFDDYAISVCSEKNNFSKIELINIENIK